MGGLWSQIALDPLENSAESCPHPGNLNYPEAPRSLSIILALALELHRISIYGCYQD